MQPLRILSNDQMAMIDEAACSILERTGMRIESDEALNYLEAFGCRVDRDTYRVRVPAKLTRQVVEKMREDYQNNDRPRHMPVRFSHVRFRATEHKVHQDFSVSAGGFNCFIHDLEGSQGKPQNII